MAKVDPIRMQAVTAAGWAFVALDATGGEAEKARALSLKCGHTIYRRVCWTGRADPHDEPAQKRAECELCAGQPAKFRLADEVAKEHASFVLELP